jgi:hypothetical protein
MAKEPQGWVQCEDHLPYYILQIQLLQLATAAVHGVFKQQRRSKNLAVVVVVKAASSGPGFWKGRCL